MTIGTQLRTKRNAAGIAGSLVWIKAGIAKSRLSDIEREYLAASEEEVARINTARDDLARAKRKTAAVAVEERWLSFPRAQCKPRLCTLHPGPFWSGQRFALLGAEPDGARPERHEASGRRYRQEAKYAGKSQPASWSAGSDDSLEKREHCDAS